MVFIGSLALVAASVILSYSVASRAFFGATTDWQDEAAVFLFGGCYLPLRGLRAANSWSRWNLGRFYHAS